MTLVYHERFLDHAQGEAFHPERPDRLRAIEHRLRREGLWEDVRAPGPAAESAIVRVHEPAYYEALRNFGPGAWNPDTWVGPQTFEIARLAAGGALLAGELAWREGRPTFALPRPPGHHAVADNAMGFCYFNNIAIAAEALRAEHGARRLAIVDIDVHHGNGTDDFYYRSRDVLFVSLHQFPYYPGTGGPGAFGIDDGLGYTVNVPLRAGCGDATYRLAFDRLIEPIIAQFAPEMILVSLGADAHYADPMAGMTLSSPCYVELVERLWALARAQCGGRFACFLEGGYDLASLAEVVTGIVALFRGGRTNYQLTDVLESRPQGEQSIMMLAERLKQWWKI